jgi:hypothetical protein
MADKIITPNATIDPMKVIEESHPLLPDPSDIYYVPFEKHLVEWTDSVVGMAKRLGCGKRIESEADWKVIEYIYKGWTVLFEDEFKRFTDKMKYLRSELSNDSATAKEGEGMIQHQMEFPQSLYGLIDSVFPLQKWDTKFVREFANKMPELRTSAKRI